MRDEWEWRAELFVDDSCFTKSGTASSQLMATLNALSWINDGEAQPRRYRIEVGPVRDIGGVR